MISSKRKARMEESLETGNWKDPEETLNYRWGGIAALLLAIGYLAIIPLFVRVGAPPTTGEEWFHYLPGKTMEWWLIIWLSVITDLLYPPVAWALWIALSKVGRKRMLASVFCLNLFVVLDLAVTWTHHASLLALFQSYSSAADDARRAACVAAADYAASIYATPLLSFYILVIPSLGLLLASVVMLKANFGKVAACTGMVTGVFGILSLTGFFPLVMANALGTTLWYILVGARLVRLGAVGSKDL